MSIRQGWAPFGLLLGCGILFARSASCASAEEPQASEIARLLRQLDGNDFKAREEGVVRLGKIGAPAMRPLVGRLAEINGREDVIKLLLNIGPPVVPALCEALQDGADHRPRQNDKRLTQCIPPRAFREEFWPDEPSGRKRWSAAETLGKLRAQAAIPQLVAALQDQEETVCTAANQALQAIGPPAIPALTAALQQPDPRFRIEAAACLLELDSEQRDSQRILIDALASQSLRHQAIRRLWKLGRLPVTPELASGLVASLQAASDELSRLETLLIVRKLGARGKDAAPPVLPLLKDTSPQVRLVATDVVWRLTNDATLAGPAALELFKRGHSPERTYAPREAFTILSEMGARANPAVATLAAIVQDPYTPEFKALVKAMSAPAPAILDAAGNYQKGIDYALIYDRLDNGREQILAAQLRREAAILLGGMGPAAKDAAPALTAQLKKQQRTTLNTEIAMALANIDPASPEVLRYALLLRDDATADVLERARYIDLLAKLGKPAVPYLIEALNDTTGYGMVEGAASRALAAINAPTAPTVPQLCKALNDRDPHVALSARHTLIHLGPQAKDAVPFLSEMLQDPKQQWLAIEVLQAIAPEAAVPALIKMLNSPDRQQRDAVLQALSSLGPAAKPALPALLEVVRDHEHFAECERAAWAISQMGALPKSAVPDIAKEMSGNFNDRAAEYLAAALGNTGPAAQAAVPPLIAAIQFHAQRRLEDRRRNDAPPTNEDQAEYDPLLVAAATALGKIGPAAKDALPALSADRFNAPAVPVAMLRIDPQSVEARCALQDALSDPRLPARVEAAGSLAKIDPPSKEALAILSVAVTYAHRDNKDNDYYAAQIRRQALSALVELGPAGMAPLSAALSDRDREFRGLAIQALVKSGARSVPCLVAALKKSVLEDARGSIDPACEFVQALGKIGPDAAGATPELMLLVAQKFERPSYLSQAAVLALGEIGPAAKAAVPDLLDALHSDDQQIRLSAEQALHKIDPSARSK